MNRQVLMVITFALAAASARAMTSPEKAAEILSLKNRGVAELEEGKNSEARRSFEKLEAILPAEALPAANAAVAALREADLSAADKFLKLAFARAPNDSRVFAIAAAVEAARNDEAKSREFLARAARANPRDLESRWRWVRSAEVDSSQLGRSDDGRKYLREILALSPSNLPAICRLLLTELSRGEAAEAKATARDLEGLLTPMDPRLAKFFSEGRALLDAGNYSESSLKFRIVENLLRVTDRYRQSLEELYTDVAGLPLLNFSPAFEAELRPGAGTPIAVHLENTRRPAAAFAPERLLRLADLTNSGKASAYDVPSPYHGVSFFDFDNDGDLDVYLDGSGGPDRLLRNNMDGSWTDVTATTGDPAFSSSRCVVDDLDRDGDLDLICVTPAGDLVWRSNLRQGRFETIRFGVGAAEDVAVADLDGDGKPDLVVATKSALLLLINRGEGRFERAPGGDLAKLPAGFSPRRVILADLDNDGFPDVIAGGDSGLAIYRNAGFHTFTWWPIAPRGLDHVDEIAAVDADGDGDLDLALSIGGRPVLLDNVGGNANNWLDVSLEGLPAGSQKVNRSGVGSLVEVKAGNLYAARTVSQIQPTHFGLGRRARADVVRCLWTNGVPQNLFDQRARTVVREVQQLKGSCPFVYARNGSTGAWSFVSDALGRAPLGLLYDGVHLATPDPREWLTIPEGALAPGPGGTLTLDYTEELWEALYLDMAHLAAVDHPEGTVVVPNERMIPGTLPKKLFTVANPRRVRSAEADGADVSDLLARADHRYVQPGAPTAYQGIRTPHELTLDLGPLDSGDRVVLYLTGWIFYTDTSINVSISQRHDLAIEAPVLEVPDGNGGWKIGMASFGFPAGKTKTMPVDLTGIVRPEDPRIRIRTNMEIYWDSAFVTVNDPPVTTRWTEIPPMHAELSFRGFSRRVRESSDGPEVFVHDDLDLVPHWANVPGRLTHYGDVTGLLRKTDDRFVAMSGGDAIRLTFDGRSLPSLPGGWRRDYILVSDGWDKDFDKNTISGTSVGPYPFHAMSTYPYPKTERFPDPSFVRDWLTRVSSPDAFLAWVRTWGGESIR